MTSVPKMAKVNNEGEGNGLPWCLMIESFRFEFGSQRKEVVSKLLGCLKAGPANMQCKPSCVRIVKPQLPNKHKPPQQLTLGPQDAPPIWQV